MHPFATLDFDRLSRTGTPEVIYGASKTAKQIATLLQAFYVAKQPALATRVDPEKAACIQEILKNSLLIWHEVAGVLELPKPEPLDVKIGNVAVVCAGTSDLPVAEEAAVVLEAFGNAVQRHVDVGIAGIHRILSRVEELKKARVVVVVAGMDGALPAVVAGLVSVPVIGVPTSVGYGAAFQGIAPLLTMLNSCSPGVVVVNIDNGFGAAIAAHRINRGAV
jgi:NCAIR mutase (PurE)-related protein